MPWELRRGLRPVVALGSSSSPVLDLSERLLASLVAASPGWSLAAPAALLLLGLLLPPPSSGAGLRCHSLASSPPRQVASRSLPASAGSVSYRTLFLSGTPSLSLSGLSVVFSLSVSGLSLVCLSLSVSLSCLSGPLVATLCGIPASLPSALLLRASASFACSGGFASSSFSSIIICNSK